MASSTLWKLKALLKKNLLILKRNICSTIFEIFFPIILILLCLALKQAFKPKTYLYTDEEKGDDEYLKSKSALYYTNSAPYDLYQLKDDSNLGLSIAPILKICSEQNSQGSERTCIASIGNPGLDTVLKDRIKTDGDSGNKLKIEYKDFETINDFKKYIKDEAYGNNDKFPEICFGVRIDKNGHNWDYSLHYFDTGSSDIPSLSGGLLNSFQTGPDLDSYKKYQENGFVYMTKIINEYILQQEGQNFKINIGMIPMKYIDYRSDPFSSFIGYIIPFFIVIAYMCPLCLYVYRMVGEKENKSKEGMKIMGLGEGTYFMSYFIQYFIIALIDSIINGLIMSAQFKKVPFIYLFLLLFLWALDVFALIFFFQSFIDKTRVALILSLLIYFVMFFLSMACMSSTGDKSIKIVLSIFPPVCIQLGIILFGHFEGNFRQFHSADFFKTYTNYCIGIMNLMQIVDFLLYLFLGYYLQNILPHEFGIKRPWYFLCTSNYWCGSNKNKNENPKNLNQDIAILDKEIDEGKDSQERKLKQKEIKKSKNSKNFEGEELYRDKTKPDDALRIQNIVKIFGDGKKAVDHVSLNFYKDEIFALLGHNGAGKTTLISMLTGLYEATEGDAYYDDYNILDSNNMEEFRTILGICPQHDVLFDDLTIREHLEMFCIFKGFTSGDIDAEVDKTIHDFELENIQNITSKNLSAGQRRKLSIAISLIGGSKVIFLDEPSSGMDITSRRNLWDILKRQSEKKIIILTTHYMEEASVLGKRIGIINAGKMKCIGTPLFLIERFGRFMSLNITKEEGADNGKIINFIGERAKDIDYEILSEEILFRIPKSNYSPDNGENLTLTENSSDDKRTSTSNFNLTKFFDDLDNNLNELGIKTYSASMPTLEDVFLNVAQDDEIEENQKMGKLHRKFSIPNEENDKILFDIDFKEDFSNKSKFFNDFRASFHRRFLLTSRDLKGFLMEILCPILLVLVGLLVSKVDMIKESDPYAMDIGVIGKQKILYGSKSGISISDYELSGNNYESETIDLPLGITNDKDLIKDFFLKIYDRIKDIEDCEDHEVDMLDKHYTGVYGSFLFLEETATSINFIEILNARIKHVVPLFTANILKKIVEKKSSAKVNFMLYPIPFTAETENQVDQMGNSLIVFFVAIAFSLIPANFVTIIVREKLNNSKHLMRVSGISIFAYWLVNFIYELVKYLFTCGICVLFLYAFDFYKDYLYIIYLLYGPAMIFVTYALSFLFDSESGAQNGIILINFLLGALGSTVILMLRSLKNLRNAAKVLQYILCLLPSFDFDFGYSLLLNKMMILMVDYPKTFYHLKDSVVIEKFDLLLSCIIFLAAETIVYALILVFIEYFAYFSFRVDDSKMLIDSNDSKVLNEIERANQESNKIGITDEKGNTNQGEYAVRIKNLQKFYLTGCCGSNPMLAIKNMSFCVEPGECFGLLGLNGAGKTTTFKCITQEVAPSHGKIYINGRDMRNSFSELSSIFGYCPQFDAIFEYMTVYENLEFYGKIKGVMPQYLDKVVRSMIEEMSLGEFVNKIAGRLSGGNKRKLSVAISFLCSPPIVLLDEPSTGMDPEARRFMWSVIHKISTKGKKASVIMTTHSMDEAETLCKRMAIMVNGEFVCLGKAGEIKEKYGYGYEVEVRIKPLSEKQFEKVISQHSLNKDMKIDMSNIEEILQKLNQSNYIKELQKGRFGSRLIRDIEMNNSVPIRTLISWTFFVKNVLLFIQNAQPYFENIILTEYIDNNFLFKMKKNSNTKTIGFFFGLFETNKDKFFVTEYSIHQTSLEQIFNMFEAQKRKSTQNEEEKKEEILIDNEVYNSLTK